MEITQLQEIKTQTDILKKIKGDIMLSKNYKVETTVSREVSVEVHHSIRNCDVCHQTCHDPCQILGDIKKACSSVLNGYCVYCTGKCHWQKHRNGWHKYELRDITEIKTVDELFRQYKVSIQDKDAKKKILVELINEYCKIKMVVFDLIKRGNECSKKLDEISLRPNYLSNVQYIERLIEAERKKTKEITHCAERLKQLENMKDLALLLQDVRTGPEVLTSKVNEMEKEIQNAMLDTLNGIDEDEDYSDAKTQSKKGFRETIRRWRKKAISYVS